MFPSGHFSFSPLFPTGLFHFIVPNKMANECLIRHKKNLLNQSQEKKKKNKYESHIRDLSSRNQVLFSNHLVHVCFYKCRENFIYIYGYVPLAGERFVLAAQKNGVLSSLFCGLLRFF